ncbi:MAG: NAD(P)/FAD-dependent oxidoreductase [Rhodospirillaceae bacterium]|jgi:L-2-hydroxyglutarate oxidase LhgO|nr:NAD(P)/FAD-dependent oxidoreductase [Rhodospirillaceae bacterium]MBT5456916.1 NAD(P)/FAD-dependent oxidoreductase [Rhodospirillaceae bacterium]
MGAVVTTPPLAQYPSCRDLTIPQRHFVRGSGVTEKVECVVIGGGVVGLAVARRLAMSGREVIVLEAAEAIGTETSSRNSEVIHAGIYYPTGSLKAEFCVAGKHALYDYCDSHGVEHRRCGKFIVATSEDQMPELERLKNVAAANGVPDLEWKSVEDIRQAEPAVFCVGALWSPSTGIIDSHGLMLAYQGDAESAGAMVAFHAPVHDGRIDDDGILLSVGGDAPMEIKADLVINSAGLHAQKVASTLKGLPAEFVPPSYYAKGNYYALMGKPPFSRPIYPVPEKAGLGVHVTVDLGGQVRFGPDVEWIDHINYDVDPRRADKFYDAVRKYYPDLADGAIQPAYSGIRPKIQSPDEPAKDFVIQGPAEHGVEALINLFGIESPGLTASLAIADHVASLVE